jgi:Zn-dependent oligopeptidase
MDMFVNCFHGDIGNKEAFRRFRDLVLERGGRQPELQTFCDFVGREPKLDAFFSWLGL